METFRKITQLLTVADIAQPIYATFLVNDTTEMAWEEFMQSSAGDPFDQIGLVMDGTTLIGSVSCDVLQEAVTVEACMEPIPSECIVASTTPLIDSLRLFSRDDKSVIYFVLTNTEITHFLHYSHFTRLPFATCMLVLVIGLEQLMLEICKVEPMRWIKNLSEGRFRKALEVYERRGFPLSDDGVPYANRILECTTLIDKFQVLKKDSRVREISPEVKLGAKKIEALRNWAAHPTSEPLPDVSDLVPLIDRIETLYAQLEEVKVKSPYQPSGLGE